MKDIIIKLPQQKRSKAKFIAIINALPRVIHEFSYAKATTAKIALEANVGIGTLYDYFSSKEAVLLAYVDYHLNAALIDSEQYLFNNMSPQEALRQLIELGVNFAFKHKAMIRLMFEQQIIPMHMPNLKQSQQKLIQLGNQFAQHASDKLVNKPSDLVFFSLSNIVVGFQLRIVASDEIYEADIIVEELLAIISPYLLK